jgi:hypothetical protein
MDAKLFSVLVANVLWLIKKVRKKEWMKTTRVLYPFRQREEFKYISQWLQLLRGVPEILLIGNSLNLNHGLPDPVLSFLSVSLRIKSVIPTFYLYKSQTVGFNSSHVLKSGRF